MYNIPLLERVYSPEVEDYAKSKARLNVGIARDLDDSYGGGVKKYLPGLQRKLRTTIKGMQTDANTRNMQLAVGSALSRKSMERQAIDSTNVATKSVGPTITPSPKKFRVIKGTGPLKSKKPGIMKSAFARAA